MANLVRHERCPICMKRGKDRHGDNLAVYSDGATYCFSCGFHTGNSAVHRISRLSLRSTQNANMGQETLRSYLTTPSDWTYKLPPKAKQWLDKYDITNEEIHRHGICWSTKWERLIFPVYNGDVLKFYQGRNFNENHSENHSQRYHTEGNRNFTKLFTAPNPNPIVLVEDYISAIKVSRWCPAICLFGSHISKELILTLLPGKPSIRVWLDKDKAREAARYTQMILQYLPDCATIITEQDPKCYDKDFISELVSRSP